MVVIHGERAVCCGDRTRRLFHSGWKLGSRIFFLMLLLFTLRSPSHTKQRSAFPRLCRLCSFSLPPHVQILTFLPRPSLCLDGRKAAAVQISLDGSRLQWFSSRREAIVLLSASSSGLQPSGRTCEGRDGLLLRRLDKGYQRTKRNHWAR